MFIFICCIILLALGKNESGIEGAGEGPDRTIVGAALAVAVGNGGDAEDALVADGDNIVEVDVDNFMVGLSEGAFEGRR